jgi:hypothetical protein
VDLTLEGLMGKNPYVCLATEEGTTRANLVMGEVEETGIVSEVGSGVEPYFCSIPLCCGFYASLGSFSNGCEKCISQW